MTNTITRSGEKAATQPQFNYLKRLVAERELDSELAEWVAAARHFAQIGDFSSKAASQLIEALLAAPRKTADTASSTEPEAGVYETPDKEWFRVYLGQQSGKMLVKQIITEDDLMGGMDVSYEYLGAAATKLPSNARRMTLEEVGQLGLATNHCMICGRRLDDPESVDRGIGPVCASKY